MNRFVLEAAPFLRIIAFVVAIASIVQIVELFVKKVLPELYRELGIFLPLIASNSQVLGLTIFQTNRGYSLGARAHSRDRSRAGARVHHRGHPLARVHGIRGDGCLTRGGGGTP